MNNDNALARKGTWQELIGSQQYIGEKIEKYIVYSF